MRAPVAPWRSHDRWPAPRSRARSAFRARPGQSRVPAIRRRRGGEASPRGSKATNSRVEGSPGTMAPDAPNQEETAMTVRLILLTATMMVCGSLGALAQTPAPPAAPGTPAAMPGQPPSPMPTAPSTQFNGAPTTPAPAYSAPQPDPGTVASPAAISPSGSSMPPGATMPPPANAAPPSGPTTSTPPQ